MSWTNGPEPVALFLLYLDAQRGYSPATVEAYAVDLRGVHEFLGRRSKGLHDPAAVTKADITALLFDCARAIIIDITPACEVKFSWGVSTLVLLAPLPVIPVILIIIGDPPQKLKTEKSADAR